MKALRLAVISVGALLALVILFVPTYILWLTLTESGGAEPEGLLTLNTKDSVRFAGDSPAAISQAVSQALFPAPPGQAGLRPDAAVVVSGEAWQAGVAAAPLVRWLNGPLLIASENSEGELDRLQSQGLPGLGGARAVRVTLGAPAGGAAPTDIAAATPADLAAQVDALVEQLAGQPHPNLLLVPDDPRFALPAAYWAAQSGDVVLFGGSPLPEATRAALERRGGQARIFLVGSGLDAAGLEPYGQVLRMAANDGPAAAVALAEFYSAEGNVGWGLDGARYLATHNFVLANPADPLTAVAGLSLARFGKFGPLLWVEHDALPPATAQYLWKMKPAYFVTPAEGPFNFSWFLGGPALISMRVQGQVDLSQEIGAYRFEEAGLSGMEVLWVVWIVAGIASALWLLLHSLRRLPQMGWMMRVTWALLALATGPLAVLLYRRSYHGVPWRRGEMAMWRRDRIGSALAASAMNRGFDGPLMLVISWISTALGLPLLVVQGPGFWLGNSMMVGIFIAYFGALVLHWLLMHAAMFMAHERLPYREAVKKAWVPAFLSMTAMAIGMMGFMWWIQMVNLMMEGMPEADDVMWWGTTLVSIVVGWLVALPVDDWLVRRGRQPGTM